MNLNLYLRQSVWDFLLVCVAAVSLTYVVLDSFYIAPALQYSPLPGVIAVVLTAALFAAARNRSTALAGGILIGLACIVGLGVSIALSGSSFLVDTEQSYFFFAVACIAVPLVSFGLSRSHVGSVVLFGAGAFICAWIQFFYDFYELTWTLLFVVSALMLIVYKNYQLCARRATTVRRLSFSAGFLTSLGAVVVSVGVACAVWLCVISPTNPEAVEIKLIQEYRALETKQVLGTSSELMTPNMDLTSDQTNDMERTTDDLVETEDGIQMPARASDETTTKEEKSGTFMGIDIEALTDIFDPITYEQNQWYFLLALLLIPIAIVAYFVGRRIMRTRRLNQMRQLPLDEQVQAIYLFMVERLKRIGLAVPEGVTLLEFARNNEATMAVFEEESGVSFAQVTSSYVASAYGKQPVSEYDAERHAAFYTSFWRAARKMLGNFKYLWASFRL